MRKTVPVLFFLATAFYSGRAQDPLGIRYAQKVSEHDMRSWLDVLASDSLEGRETGKPGQKKAAAFIARQFLGFGLDPAAHGGYFQYISLSPRTNAGRNFVVNEKIFLYMRDFFYSYGQCDSSFEFTRLIFAGYGITDGSRDDYAGVSVFGKPVLILEGRPAELGSGSPIIRKWDLPEKIRLAKEKGAAMVLVATDSLNARIDEKMYGDSPSEPLALPWAFVSMEMAQKFWPEADEGKFDKALKKITRKGKVSALETITDAHLPFIKKTSGLRGENVLGYIEGTDLRNEVLVLTAHYDHLGIRDSAVYHGADDDGSGTTALIQMAKLFCQAAADGMRPRRTILFMAVAGEEKGLLGSRYYVNHPVFPLKSTVANLNTDMIGRVDPKHDSLHTDEYIYIIGSDKLSTELHSINETINANFSHLQLDYEYNKPDDPNRYYYRSDHYNFAKNNIPVIFYFNGTHADYHKPTDTIDKIRFDLMAKRTQLIFLTAWELANRSERIKVDVVSDMPDKKEE